MCSSKARRNELNSLNHILPDGCGKHLPIERRTTFSNSVTQLSTQTQTSRTSKNFTIYHNV